MTTTQWEILWSDFRESAKTNPAQLYRRGLIHKHLAIPRCSKSIETNAPNQNEVKILDAGSGPGDLLAELNERYPQAGLLGLELSATGIDYAKRIAPQAEYRQTDLSIPHPIPKAFLGWATHGICSEVLEHVDHPLVFLQQLQRYLQRGGKLVVTVPSGPMTAFDRYLGHRRHYTASTLRDLLTEAGFTEVKVYRAGFPFFNIYRLLVYIRGTKLIKDARGTNTQWLSKVFSLLFHLNLSTSPWGWQLIATGVAR